MTADLIFNVKNLFDADSVEGALQQYGSKQYYIPPYQRGYKWLSITPEDAVCVLMQDLLDAYPSKGEYYLQFISTKISVVDQVKVLELIDGQQRLTTLTLLLSVLYSKLAQKTPAISDYKLTYRVRPVVTTFFEQFIYSNIDDLFNEEWSTFHSKNENYNEQDIFYLFHAVKKINAMIEKNLLNKDFNLGDFRTFVEERVKVILNNIDGKVNCEKVFTNLNDNKVELTNPELIKGLILTRAARENSGKKNKSSYEIAEIRAVMGRRWDEIDNWSNRKDVSLYFSSNGQDTLHELLYLIAIKSGFKGKEKTNDNKELFNYFQSEVKKGKQTIEVFFALKKLQQVFNDWFLDVDIYNLIGFLTFAKSPTGKFSLKDLLAFIEYSKTALRGLLREKAFELIPDSIEQLEYKVDNDLIWNVLLAINVFQSDIKFDFLAFSINKWSLEHIFPQNPAKVASHLGIKDIALYKSLLESSNKKISDVVIDGQGAEDLVNVGRNIDEKLSKDSCILLDIEKAVIYQLIRTDKLNSVGNIAFLTSSVNSSNSNGMFDSKRQNVVSKISKGHFVPKHTYDVFSKLLSHAFDPDLSLWTEKDILIHLDWIKIRIQQIKQS